MTRPTRITVNSGDNSWESQLNTNLQQLYDRPLPPYLHAGTLADLESTYGAASYQWCIAVVDYDGAGTPGQHMAFSNGTAWKLASNWEFVNRRVIRSVSASTSVVDTDDTIVTTGASSFTVTLPTIADANEGRVVRVKHQGTGTITIATPGGDTIDTAASFDITSQYDAFEFVSDGTSDWQKLGGGSGGGASDFVSLTDTPANFSGAGGQTVRVNSGATALEFVDPSILDMSDTPASFAGAGGQTVRVNSGATALEFVDPSFLDLSDTPASFAGSGGMVVKVNAGATGLEFVAGGAGVTDFTDLGDVPSSYVGQGSKFVKVNAGETALEFVTSGGTATHLGLTDTPSAFTGAGGQSVRVNSGETALEYSKNGLAKRFESRRWDSGDTKQTLTVGGVVLNWPTAANSNDSPVTWDSVNKVWDVDETGTYQIFMQVTWENSANEIYTLLELDPLGVGSYATMEGTLLFGRGSTRGCTSMQIIVDLTATDKIRAKGFMPTGTGVQVRDASSITIIRLY